jgi:hypothetical protein
MKKIDFKTCKAKTEEYFKNPLLNEALLIKIFLKNVWRETCKELI